MDQWIILTAAVIPAAVAVGFGVYMATTVGTRMLAVLTREAGETVERVASSYADRFGKWLLGLSLPRSAPANVTDAATGLVGTYSLALEILGLPAELGKRDLESKHRDIVRRLDTKDGGAEWLIAEVNWAKEIIEVERGWKSDLARAKDILGLPDGYKEKDAKDAHDQLLRHVRPDVGGSEYLAGRVAWALATIKAQGGNRDTEM